MIRTIAAVAFLICSHANASVLIADRLVVDLTDAKQAASLITWGMQQQPLQGGRPEGLQVPDPSLLNLTKNGFGWDGEANSGRDAWIKTNPISVAYEWRPPTRCPISVVVKPDRAERTTTNGTTYRPYAGDIYARYSADRKNWSSWHQFKQDKVTDEEAIYSASLGVPYVDRLEYDRWLNQYQQLDVPWISDETAAAKWIDKQDPTFFDKNIPYIGYVELLYEAQIQGDQRIKALEINWTYAVSGLHAPPRDDDAYQADRQKWSFRRDEQPEDRAEN